MMADLDEERRKRLMLALSDPGSVLPRDAVPWNGSLAHETLPSWQMRAVETAIGPWLASHHDPDDTCNCEPGDLQRKGICEYRMLADSVGDAFNPPDGDEAEVAILIRAAEVAQQYIAGQPCTCTPEMIADWDACPRCRALGRRGDKRVDR